MGWFKKIMAGRYGSDQFNVALTVMCLILMVVYQTTGFYPLVYISYLPILFALFRMFSRNYAKRRAENAWFMRGWTPVRAFIVRRFVMLRQSGKYRFFKCPSCSATTRVPRGKGKIEIRCPKCGAAFIKKA